MARAEEAMSESRESGEIKRKAGAQGCGGSSLDVVYCSFVFAWILYCLREGGVMCEKGICRLRQVRCAAGADYDGVGFADSVYRWAQPSIVVFAVVLESTGRIIETRVKK